METPEPSHPNVESDTNSRWAGWRSGIGVLDTFIDDVTADDQFEDAPAPEEFKATELPKTVDRFWSALKPFIDFVDAVEDVMHYKEPRVTFTFLIYYMILVWYGRVVPGAFLLVIGLIMKGWAECNGYLPNQPDTTAAQSQTNDAVDSEVPSSESNQPPSQQARDQQRHRGGVLGGLVHYAMGKVGEATQKYHQANKAAGKVTKTLNHYSTILEKIASLVDWSNPDNTWLVIALLSILYFVTMIVPWDILTFIMKIQFGFKFFVSEYLFQSREHLKLKYSTFYRFWMNLPTKGKVKNAGSSVHAASQNDSTASPAHVPAHAHPVDVSHVSQEGSTSMPVRDVSAPTAVSLSVNSTAAKPYAISAPTDPTPPKSVITSLGERVLGTWQTIYMNIKRPAKLVLTEKHLCIIRNNGDEHSGSLTFAFGQIVSITRQNGTMATNLLSGFSLVIVMRPNDGDDTSETVPHRFQVLKGNEVYSKICAAAGIPMDASPQTNPAEKKSL